MTWPSAEDPSAPMTELEAEEVSNLLNHIRKRLLIGVNAAYQGHPHLAEEKRKSIQQSIGTLIRHTNEARARLGAHSVESRSG